MHCFNSSVFLAISLLTLCGALVDATGDCLVSTSVVSVCVCGCVCVHIPLFSHHQDHFYVLVFFFIMQCQHADSEAQRFEL